MAEALINAEIFIGGYDVGGDFNQVALEYSAESLDETAFQQESRRMRGGLKVSRLTGSGYWRAGNNLPDKVLHESLALPDVIVTVFPAAIVEGSTSTGAGYMFAATLARYTFGGTVGAILPFSLEAEGRGAGS